MRSQLSPKIGEYFTAEGSGLFFFDSLPIDSIPYNESAIFLKHLLLYIGVPYIRYTHRANLLKAIRRPLDESPIRYSG